MNAKSDAGDCHSCCPQGMRDRTSPHPFTAIEAARVRANLQRKGVSSWK